MRRRLIVGGLVLLLVLAAGLTSLHWHSGHECTVCRAVQPLEPSLPAAGDNCPLIRLAWQPPAPEQEAKSRTLVNEFLSRAPPA